MVIKQLQQSNNPQEVVQLLIENANPRVVQDGVCDYILTDHFFPTLDETFVTRHLVTEDEVENFKQTFDFGAVGIIEDEKEKLIDKIKSIKSIDRLISLIEKHIPSDMKKQIVVDYIIRTWLEKNYKGNLNEFISGLNREYWNLE